MARNKQTGPELKLYQIDTMLYIGTKIVFTKLSMFVKFLKEGGVDVADKLNINRARALERYEKNYEISDIKELNIDGQANETWLRKNGLLYSIDGRYELSPIANAIIRCKINIADYCFLLLSKQWIKVKEPGGKDEYKANLLSVILEDLLNCHSILAKEFITHVGQIVLDRYKDKYKELTLSNKEAARYITSPLLLSRLIVEKDGYYILNPNMYDLATDYVENSKKIKRIDQVSCSDEEYWNSFQYGFYDIINKDNEHLYLRQYPHLFAMKELYKDRGTLPLQQIFYGAPGTGKSHGVKTMTEGRKVIRTTFHPDSDYSTFVGAYKPTSVEVPDMTKIGTKAVPVENPDGTPRMEKKIVYEFVPQAFLKAYTGAWKNQDEPFFLIIEEINRGNCAQIFGDLFQLLDRNDETGVSCYPISPDEDIRKFLLTDKKYGFAVLTEEQKASIPEDVLLGELMILPKNFYIWATMNTSDQSLFPIDSAFKRRWDWQYMPISDAKKGWQIEANGKRYDWWQFLQKINDKIETATYSEDKKLGYFFCKAKDGIIDAETFVGKVLFYLWNDVFKDFAEQAGGLFNDDDGLLSFHKFYTVGDDGKTKVREDKVERFLQNLGVEPMEEDTTSMEVSSVSSLIKVNGKDVGKYINAVPYTTIEEYVRLNNTKTAQDIIDIWEPYVKYSYRSWIVANQETYNNLSDRDKQKTHKVNCADGTCLWVNTNGWTHYPKNKDLRDTVKEFIEAVNNSGLGIQITEESI